MMPDEKTNVMSQIFWARVFCAVFVGLLSGSLGFSGAEGINGIFIAFGVYVLTYYYARFLLKGVKTKYPSHKIVTNGLWSYIMLFLFTWILHNTFRLYL